MTTGSQEGQGQGQSQLPGACSSRLPSLPSPYTTSYHPPSSPPPTIPAQQAQDNHSRGAMYITDTLLEQLVDQANKELLSSSYYLSYSLWFADQELPGSAVSFKSGKGKEEELVMIFMVERNRRGAENTRTKNGAMRSRYSIIWSRGGRKEWVFPSSAVPERSSNGSRETHRLW